MYNGKRTEPLVSVVVPVYNCEKSLGETLKHLLCQSYENIELILVDDGSEDGSAEICERAADGDGRVRLIRQEHSGVSRARNIGALAADGEYIGFCDSDDIPSAELYGRLYRLAAESGSDIAALRTSEALPNADGCAEGEVVLFDDREELLKRFLLYRLPTSVCTKLFKRELARSISFDESVKMNEDRLYTFEAIMKCGRFIYENSAAYTYRRRKRAIEDSARAAEKYGDIPRAASMIEERIIEKYPKLSEFAEAGSAVANLRYTQLMYGRGLDGENPIMTDRALKKLKSADLRFCREHLDRRLCLKLRLARYGFLYKTAVKLFSRT